MTIWIEALLGLAAIVLCAVACWREDQLVAWENKITRELKNRDRKRSDTKT